MILGAAPRRDGDVGGCSGLDAGRFVLPSGAIEEVTVWVALKSYHTLLSGFT